MGCFRAPRHGGKRLLWKGPLRGLWNTPESQKRVPKVPFSHLWLPFWLSGIFSGTFFRTQKDLFWDSFSAQCHGCDTRIAIRAAIHRSLRARNRKKKISEWSFWGSAEKSPKIPENVYKYRLPDLIDRLSRAFFGTFLQAPQKSRARKTWRAHCELKHWNLGGWMCLIHGLHCTV